MLRRRKIVERAHPGVSSLADLEREIAEFEAQVERLGREEMTTHSEDRMPPPILSPRRTR